MVLVCFYFYPEGPPRAYTPVWAVAGIQMPGRDQLTIPTSIRQLNVGARKHGGMLYNIVWASEAWQSVQSVPRTQ